MKILVAEDDRGSRLALAATLMKLGHEVVQAATGLDALRLTREGHQPVGLGRAVSSLKRG